MCMIDQTISSATTIECKLFVSIANRKLRSYDVHCSSISLETKQVQTVVMKYIFNAIGIFKLSDIS